MPAKMNTDSILCSGTLTLSPLINNKSKKRKKKRKKKRRGRRMERERERERERWEKVKGHCSSCS
jgi:hypothetical protein